MRIACLIFNARIYAAYSYSIARSPALTEGILSNINFIAKFATLLWEIMRVKLIAEKEI